MTEMKLMSAFRALRLGSCTAASRQRLKHDMSGTQHEAQSNATARMMRYIHFQCTPGDNEPHAET